MHKNEGTLAWTWWSCGIGRKGKYSIKKRMWSDLTGTSGSLAPSTISHHGLWNMERMWAVCMFASCSPNLRVPLVVWFRLRPLMSGCRNFLKDKQRDDISVAGENIIGNKQWWKRPLRRTDIAVAVMKLLICQIFTICSWNRLLVYQIIPKQCQSA